jgi:hypothetical protein
MTGRDRLVVMVVAFVALFGGFWFMVLSPKRAQIGVVNTKIAAAEKRLGAAKASVAVAEQAKRSYDADYAAVARLGKAVPVDDDVPSLVYQLQSVSNNAKVDFLSFKLASSGAAPAPAALTSAAPAAATSASGSSSSTATPTPAPATQLAAAALPPGATVGAAGFPTMPFTFVFTGSYFDMEHMIDQVDHFIGVKQKAVSVHGRLLSIDGFALTAGPAGLPSVSATLAATAYLLPASQGLTAGATAAAPGAAATPTSTGAATAPPTAAATGVTP